MKKSSTRKKSSRSQQTTQTVEVENHSALLSPKPTPAKKESQPVDSLPKVGMEEIIKAAIFDLKDICFEQLGKKPITVMAATVLSGYLVGRVMSPRKKVTRFVVNRLLKLLGKQAIRYGITYVIDRMLRTKNVQSSI